MTLILILSLLIGLVAGAFVYFIWNVMENLHAIDRRSAEARDESVPPPPMD